MFQGFSCSQRALAAVLLVGPLVTMATLQGVDAAPPVDLKTLGDTFESEIQPLLAEFCLECHSTASREGELDLERFTDLQSLRSDPAVWKLVVEQLEIGDMPPADSPQPKLEQRVQIFEWIDQYLHAEAYASVDDPGPAVPRRLSNAEYTYSLRDLTGVASLDPAHEFPADGAAGEGFTNAGAALSMSPALLAKYLDAAKEVSAHLVPLPSGFRFSRHTTARDWSEESLAEIRGFYDRYSESGQQRTVSFQGINIELNDAGVIPLERYFAALLTYKTKLKAGTYSTHQVAQLEGLNAKYLQMLWQALSQEDPNSPLLASLAAQFWKSNNEDPAGLVAYIRQWQTRLWRFGTVGHIGKVGGPKSWQETADPIVTSLPIDVPFELNEGQQQSTITVHAEPFGPTGQPNSVLLVDGRVLLSNQQAIRVAEADAIVDWVRKHQPAEQKRTALYLQTLADSAVDQASLEELSGQRQLNLDLLRRWSIVTGIGAIHDVMPRDIYTQRLDSIGGYQAMRGWGSHETPSMLANSANELLQFSTLAVPPRAVCVHPSPTLESVVSWRAPSDQTIKVTGHVADADANCGNGVAFRVEAVRPSGVVILTEGIIDNGGRAEFNVDTPVAIPAESVVRLVINPRDNSHACDTTHVDMTLTSVSHVELVWNLSKDVVDRIGSGNPVGDSLGNNEVWYFGSQPVTPQEPSALIAESRLRAWRDALVSGVSGEQLTALAKEVELALLTPETDADRQVAALLQDWTGPLEWTRQAAKHAATLQASGEQATTPLQVTLPRELAVGARWLATAVLPQDQGAVVVRVNPSSPTGSTGTLAAGPVLVANHDQARQHVAEQLDQFRSLFPAALCYTKIVPVDEVVTLRLYYREDDHLKRLMLSDAESAELDRLWSELTFVSREPLKLVDVYEQLWQYATQDADPSAFEPLREPIKQRADEFRQTLIEAETPQLAAVIDFAERAWRRPLANHEHEGLSQLYHRMRLQEIDHDLALRMTFARILIAPEFLYKLEKAPNGDAPADLDDHELATRLSYFLWSSVPDQELTDLAGSDQLSDPQVLRGEVRRLLADPRVRRMAIEFGCQWLGVKDFDQLDEKSESLFPDFAELRVSMNEETIRFWEDMLQKDRSVLSILDSDHTFVDERLAKFYRVPFSGDGWQRLDNTKAIGRGGILGLATTLAKQSGASRTSPILRGNWVYESLLGSHLPKPPKNVPQLPETVPQGLTERELIELHSSEPACAKCHVKIDPYGFALEAFDAIGAARDASNTRATLPDGESIDGLAGLREYLLTTRRDEFLRQFNRKLLGYALGRGVLLTDEPLLDAMDVALEENEYRISAAIETIVASPQFRQLRPKNVSSILTAE